MIRPRNSSCIQILLADDHPLIFTGLQALLRGTRYQISNWISDGAKVLDAVWDEDPDLILLDDRLPNRRGLELFRDLRSAGDKRPVVLLSGQISFRRAAQALDAGVSGLIFKNRPETLLECLDEVMAGRRWNDWDLTNPLLQGPEARLSVSAVERLTERERAIVQLVAAGLTCEQIADRLGSSRITVRVHLHNIYKKLDLRDHGELMLLIDQTC